MIYKTRWKRLSTPTKVHSFQFTPELKNYKDNQDLKIYEAKSKIEHK